MRIGCLQFAPQVGDVDANLNRAEAVLDQHEDLDLDLLILPELAFSGYNFRSLRDIAPFLEPTAAGVSSSWARATALKYDCNVIVGYPETADVSHKWPSDPEYYNSALVVNQDGDTWGHYRKTHLYYTDETWALEGSGFFKEHLPGIGKVAMGICMDLNPYKFEAPWTDYEFAVHARNIAANVVVLSMAWLTREPADAFCSQPKEPDMETLTYWIKRLEPLIRADDDDEVIVIFANRCGTEDDAVYAGTSAVIGIQSGEVTVYGLLGRAEEKLLIVDTKGPGFAKLVYRPEHSEQDESSEVSDGQFEQPDADNASHDTLTRTYEHPSNTNDGLNATGLAGHRTHGHVFLGIDPSSPMSTNFSQSVFSDSPLSPRYFWDQSSRIGAPVPTQFPPRNMRGQHQDGRASVVSRSTVFSQDGTQRHSVMSDARTDPQTEFSRLMGRLRGNPTPRNGSADKATGFRAQQKEPSQQQVFPHVQDYKRKQSSPRREPAPSQQETKTPKSNIVQVSKQGPLHGRPSQVPSRDETPVAARSRNDTKSSSQERMGSPELDRLGVDLIAMRLAAETQNKRDSLLCHVDEDDFIILQTLRRDSPTLETSEIEDKPHKNTLRSRHLASKKHGDERQHTTTPQHDTLHSDRYNTPDRVDRVETYRREPAMSPPSKTLSNFVAREVAHRHSNSDLQASAKSSRSRLKEGPTERSGSASQLTREKRHAETPVANQHDAVRSSTLRDGHRQAPVLRSHADTPSRSKSRDKAGTKAPLSISIAPPVPSSESPKSGMRAGQRREKKNDSTTRAADMPPTPKAMVLPPSVDFAVYEKKQGKTSKGSPPPRAGIIDPEPRKALADSAIGVFDMGSAAAKVARPRSAVW